MRKALLRFINIYLSPFNTYFWFLILIILTIIVFYPVSKFDLLEQDWSQFEFTSNHFAFGFLPFKLPLGYYLTEYGTLFGIISITFELFGSNAIAYYLFNIALRVLAAYSLYRLTSYWSSRRILGISAAFFFNFSFPGLENTYWTSQTLTYISAVLLCLSLYHWKRYHDLYPQSNFKKPLLIFLLAVFIGHIRIFMLPFILLLGEVYLHFAQRMSFKKSPINSPELKIRRWRFGETIAKYSHIFYLVLTTLIILLGTSLYTGIQASKIVHPYILIQSLFEGNPPILDSFFLYISNLLIFPDLIMPTMLNFKNNINIPLILAVSLSSIGFIFLTINLWKKRVMLASACLIAVAYPLSIYLTQPYLTDWEPVLIVSTLLGGSLFIWIILISFLFWKSHRQYLELVILGCIIAITHIALPWSMFPQSENNISSLYDITNRYYTIPSLGISILLGFIFTISYDAIKKAFLSRVITPLTLMGIISVTFILLLVFFNALTINQYLIQFQNKLPDKARHVQLWNITKPFFEKITDKESNKIIYFEGSRNENDVLIINNYLPHQITAELGNFNVSFILDKSKVLSLIRSTEGSFDKEKFFAIKIDNQNHLYDIKAEILNEAAYNP